jgi:hypothetical protein
MSCPCGSLSDGESNLSQVQSIAPVQEEFVQGFPVKSLRFKLKGVTSLYTEAHLEKHQHVEGTFTGRVVGYSSEGQDDMNHVWVIEVLDADLRG